MSEPELRPTSTSFVLPQLAVGASVLNAIELLANATAALCVGAGVGVTVADGVGLVVGVAIGVGVTPADGVAVGLVVAVGVPADGVDVVAAVGVGVTPANGVGVGLVVAVGVGMTVGVGLTVAAGFVLAAGADDGALRFVLTLHTGDVGSFCATMSCGETGAGGVAVFAAAFNAAWADAEGCQMASIC